MRNSSLVLWGLVLSIIAIAVATADLEKNEETENDVLRKPKCRRIKKPCELLHGHCIGRTEHCYGKVFDAGCSGKRCKCCYPDLGNCNEDCGHWCYPGKDWPYTCPNYCNGTNQSPIDICSDSAALGPDDLQFSTSYSDPIPEIQITNNGHTVGASSASFESMNVFGGGLPAVYNLAQFHFHWGCENNRGSEHTVDGNRYALELHLVHYNTNYGNLSEALKYDDGLAVLGIFFDVGAENAALKPITDNLLDVEYPGSNKQIVFNLALMDLIPSTRDFYRYKGSLTTPTCNEVVIWSVFATPLSISKEQLKAFRMLKDHADQEMCDNYRGIQPLNGRPVTKYQQ